MRRSLVTANLAAAATMSYQRNPLANFGAEIRGVDLKRPVNDETKALIMQDVLRFENPLLDVSHLSGIAQIAA